MQLQIVNCRSQIPATSARTMLVDMGYVRCHCGLDDHRVQAMVDIATHPQHLRFVFDLGAGNRQRRTLRFWAREVDDFRSVAGLDIDGALREMLGARRAFFRRGDLIVQWILTRPHMSQLIQLGALPESRDGILRTSAEQFLRSRWIGGGDAPANGN